MLHATPLTGLACTVWHAGALLCAAASHAAVLLMDRMRKPHRSASLVSEPYVPPCRRSTTRTSWRACVWRPSAYALRVARASAMSFNFGICTPPLFRPHFASPRHAQLARTLAVVCGLSTPWSRARRSSRSRESWRGCPLRRTPPTGSGRSKRPRRSGTKCSQAVLTACTRNRTTPKRLRQSAGAAIVSRRVAVQLF